MKTYQDSKHICIFKGLAITTFYTESLNRFIVNARCPSGVSFAEIEHHSEDEGEAVFKMMKFIQKEIRFNRNVVKNHIAHYASQDI